MDKYGNITIVKYAICEKQRNGVMWYVIQTLKGREKKVADEVVRDVAGADEPVFIFENEMEYKVNGEWVRDRNPFFPGYIFVELEEDRAEDFDFRLRKEKHPLKLMGIDGRVTPIRPDEEAYLTSLGGEDHVIRYSEGFRVDDRVEIVSGSFKGWKGEIKKLNRHKRRARIRVSLMGIDMDVDIGLGIIKNLTFEELESEAKVERLNMARIVPE